MKRSLAHTFIIISLTLSIISFILSLIAFFFSNWKSIQLRSTFTPLIPSENTHMDPLIRGEVTKYLDILYRRGETHSFGLLTHCVNAGNCGRNLLPSLDETNYGLCQDINSHHQCIFSGSLLSLTTNDNKCTCQKPSYVSITHTLLIVILVLQIIFLIMNILRLYRHRWRIPYLNDIQLRVISIISTLFPSVFLVIIILQQNNNRLTEPLEFFESMRRHYLQKQIYSFSNDLELIIKQIERDLDIRIGASYICIIIILILTIISFLTSSTVEIKILSMEKNYYYQNHNDISIPPVPTERFVPSEQIRFIRQTKV